ncbi:MAG: UDP-glucose/GDP-mannose dehydrogenase family protein [Candidatus Eisenbacteria bacterium]|uniref:UDP-glucose 6-dehydrogenase n=1 Tax=Eiseniibacteriota bacterium TaxID=2212470 RepID=A0A849SGM2_UNCEI|nr:UDP-glucose/GDP-mannose dehydrogenase family protein [Candidatus Eisenbacteria bacterium]
MYNITVVGTGYVGLVTGACLADFGNTITCVDADPAKIERMKALQLPFYEPGLPDLVERNVKEGRLKFSSDLVGALKGAHVVFITVGTPPLKDGSADTSAIYAVAKTVARNLDGYKLIVQKSTAPVGTARHLQSYMRKFAKRGAQFDVASNPEFLREGSAIETFMRPDRVVIGAETPKAQEILRKIHDPLFLIETPMVVTRLETAELIKYAANCFLATKISFINEIANVCEALGADVQMVAKGIGMDRRIGSKFLHAGPGYGGSCFPKDTMALAAFARAAGTRVGIVEATIEANENQMKRMVEKVVKATGSPRGKRVGVLGLAFKPNTDDLRAAPALTIIAGLKRRGYKVQAFDPIAMPGAARLPELRGVELKEDAYEAARGADALVIVTEWNEFRNLDLKKLKRLLKKPVICDFRNIYDRDEVESAGMLHVGVGRGRPKLEKSTGRAKG